MAFRSPDSSLDRLDSSVEMLSPSPILQPRRLRFISPIAAQDNGKNVLERDKIKMDAVNMSPPYRKVRALRLFDTPATPKTILQKSQGKFHNHLSTKDNTEKTSTSEKKADTEKTQNVERPRSLPLHNRTLENVMLANINPFTPDSLMAHNKKRARTQFGRENLSNRSLQLFLNYDDTTETLGESVEQAPKRLALQETNISRYQKEFIEVSLIGIGEFGFVYQCLNRLDGCVYAIKRSKKPVAGSSFEKRALNEVWAHAVLGKHDNVVRYYSAWAEDDHMLIQNEYCNGGSLQSLLQKRCLEESELKILLLHVAEGLRYIHSNDLVHMDLKSGNIFITKVPPLHKSPLPPLTKECYEVGMEGVYEELNNSECIITYKIGDLGHVTWINDANVEEGDCRYLPNEILQEDFRYLDKADIFSLGITLFEAAGGGPLPKNGPEWHALRNGQIPHIPTLSVEFNELIKQMTHPDPEKRPSSTSIFNHPILSSMESKTKAQLSQELTIEKRKNEILLGKLREAKKLIKQYEQKAKANKIILGSPKLSLSSERRCLRSFTRQKAYMDNKMNGLRDRNKNVINNVPY